MKSRTKIRSVRASKSDTIGKKLNSAVPCIDTHFHGAYGIDLMSVQKDQKGMADLNLLAEKLFSANVVGFCPTTLSAAWENTLATVAVLGEWTKSIQRNSRFGRQRTGKNAKSYPFGLHLEGPFLNPNAAGAHPPNAIIDFSFARLEMLWKESQNTIKIITLAPELLSNTAQKNLVKWANQRKIRLQIGHTKATHSQAQRALENGFHGVTHAWNAMHFHHREPGVLGAAIAQNSTSFIEIIPDGIHVHPALVTFFSQTLPERLLWVSDAAPCAGLFPGESCTFGPLKVQNTPESGARVILKNSSDENSPLAGGGTLLSTLVQRHLAQKKPAERHQWRKWLNQVCYQNALRYLGR